MQEQISIENQFSFYEKKSKTVIESSLIKLIIYSIKPTDLG